MVSPRPWVVVTGALAMGLGIGGAAATVLSGEGGQNEVVGPGVVLTAEPSAEPNLASSDDTPEPTVASDAPAAPVDRPARESSEQRRGATSPTSASPDPVAAPDPVPAPAPAPQPVVAGDDADSPSESSADSAD